GDDVGRIERPQAGQVEDRTEVNVEWVVALAGEDLDAAVDRVDRIRGERRIVRCRARADIHRRGAELVAQLLGITTLNARDAVEFGRVSVPVVRGVAPAPVLQ